MVVKTAVRLALKSERNIISNLMQMYLHDLSEFDRGDVSADGRYEYKYLEDYWIERERHPFLILYNGSVAGFALVREFEPGARSMAEFFILRKFRKAGVGSAAAQALFKRFKGTWHVAQEEENMPAYKFWRKTIDAFTDGAFKEDWSEKDPRGPVQIFASR